MEILNKKLSVTSEVQFRWHEQERLMFVHFAPNTWQNQEYDDLSTPLSDINPQNLDTDQWCRVALSWGAKEILFVAKHVGGFCWWPTKSSDYNVSNIPWKGGKGDLLRDISESCKKFGLNLGVYVYPGDAYLGAYLGGGGATSDKEKQAAYTKAYRTQLEEVLSNYGDMIEVWFDGNNNLPINDILEKYASKCVVFQSPHATIRWCGNEKGMIPYPSWSTIDKRFLATGVATARHSDPDGDTWAALEADVPLYTHNWFWSSENEHKRKSVEELLEIYYKSVGRGSVMLLNASPTTNGDICPGDAKRYADFGKALEERFSNALKGRVTVLSDGAEIEFDEPASVNHLIIKEDYRHGERIRKYTVYGEGENGKIELCKGSMVGSCRIQVFPTVKVKKIIFSVDVAAAEPMIKSVAAYCVDDDIEALLKKLDDKPRTTDNLWQKCGDFGGSDDYAELETDLTSKILFAGEYVVDFFAGKGRKKPELKDAVAVLEGFPTPGFADIRDNGTVVINRTAAVTDATSTALRIKVKGNPCEIRVKPY